MSDFIVGLDLGQAQDYTALAVVERVPQFAVEDQVQTVGNMTYYRQGVKVEKPAQLHVRHLERYALGTLYPDIVRGVAALLAMPQLAGARLVVDATGVGRPVVDMFRQARLRPMAVLITGGSTVSQDKGFWRVPKRDLVAAVQAPLQDSRLKFAQGLDLAPTLIQEMLNFRVKITEAANDTYGAWREGEHDDLILAVMLAAWAVQRPRGQNHIPPSGGSRSLALPKARPLMPGGWGRMGRGR